jgi:predicted metalloendopeptidase
MGIMNVHDSRFSVLANYMMWEVICQSFQYFPRAISEKFARYLDILYRKKSESDRTKTCLSFTRDQLDLPLSLIYIDEKLGEDELKSVS